MAAGYRNRSQEKKIDKINRKPACDNGSKIIAGFHLGFKVWGGGRFTHTAKCLATPIFVDHTPYYMLVHHSTSIVTYCTS